MKIFAVGSKHVICALSFLSLWPLDSAVQQKQRSPGLEESAPAVLSVHSFRGKGPTHSRNAGFGYLKTLLFSTKRMPVASESRLQGGVGALSPPSGHPLLFTEK